MFELTDKAIEPLELRKRLVSPETGALVVFEGCVRNHHHGRAVERLEYEAFAEMALSEGASLLAEAEQRFPGTTIVCVHRVGALAIGELAVWIGVAASHRGAAFGACRMVIEELKRRLPVWKKEFYVGAAAEWVDCTTDRNPKLREEAYRARMEKLAGVGAAGLSRFRAAAALVVGAGGLGCIAADALVSAGVGRVDILDPDEIELSNLHRQHLYGAGDLGLSKAGMAESRLRDRNPFVQVSGHQVRLDAGNARTWVAGRQVVLDCTDGFAARFALHDACLALGVPLVQAAATGWEGTLNTFGLGTGGCLHCLWPEKSPGELATVGDCAGGAVFGPAVNTLGLWQASEALRLLAGLSVRSASETLLLSLEDYETTWIPRPKLAGCPVCSRSGGAEVKGTTVDGDLYWDPQYTRKAGGLPIACLDAVLLPPAFCENPVLRGGEAVWARLLEAARSEGVLVCCQQGLRSADLVRQLRQEGGRAWVLRGVG